MKTLALNHDRGGVSVSLEFSEFELTTLVALVEEGRKRIAASQSPSYLTSHIDAVANEFMSLLGHLELLSAQS